MTRDTPSHRRTTHPARVQCGERSSRRRRTWGGRAHRASQRARPRSRGASAVCADDQIRRTRGGYYTMWGWLRGQRRDLLRMPDVAAGPPWGRPAASATGRACPAHLHGVGQPALRKSSPTDHPPSSRLLLHHSKQNSAPVEQGSTARLTVVSPSLPDWGPVLAVAASRRTRVPSVADLPHAMLGSRA